MLSFIKMFSLSKDSKNLYEFKNISKMPEKRIKQCDIVLVMVGKHTHKASGVLKEVGFARQYNKPIAQIIAYSDLVNPTPVENAGRLYRWSWENLKALLK